MVQIFVSIDIYNTSCLHGLQCTVAADHEDAASYLQARRWPSWRSDGSSQGRVL